MKTFETEKHSIPEGATHYSEENYENYFLWCKVDINGQVWGLVDDESILKTVYKIEKPRTKTEFVKCEFECASDAIKFQEGTGNFLAIKPNVIEVYEASGLHDVLNWYERGETLYRKVETEIDERQEFIDAIEEHCHDNGFGVNRIFLGSLFDSGKFKLVE